VGSDRPDLCACSRPRRLLNSRVSAAGRASCSVMPERGSWAASRTLRCRAGDPRGVVVPY